MRILNRRWVVDLSASGFWTRMVRKLLESLSNNCNAAMKRLVIGVSDDTR